MLYNKLKNINYYKKVIKVDIEKFLQNVNSGKPIPTGTEIHNFMVGLSNEAMKITTRLNNSYHTPEEIRELFTQLTGNEIDSSFCIFPPFYTDCGKNIHIGKNVFINTCCHFQDQGGIFIGDGVLIGHNVTMATLDHGFAPEDRGTTYPAPIILEKNAWVGANVTIVSGVRIGENAIIAAGAVVTKDIPANVVAGGVPARILKEI